MTIRMGKASCFLWAASFLGAVSALAGEIHLEVSPLERVQKVYAVDRSARSWPRPKYDGERRGDLWVVPGLADGYYDLWIAADEGVVEGANMRVINEIGEEEVPGKDAPALTDKDIEAIRDYGMKMKIWENKRRILAVAGHQNHARVLIEKLMTEDTSLPSAEPQCFWRAEVWNFESRHGGWVKLKRVDLLERERLTVDMWKSLRYRFDPAIGGIRVSGQTPAQLQYQLPPPEWPEDDWKQDPSGSEIQ